MKKTTVGFAMTGSYCTFEKNLPGLPGKYAPDAAAEALENACRQIFRQETEGRML